METRGPGPPKATRPPPPQKKKEKPPQSINLDGRDLPPSTSRRPGVCGTDEGL
ncbi:predicted protein [Plenodomus lingam JN3]|uniref:Predicted protein n=1 Tax=Leptosphaeria maculans (strain JN3 / isolate v23.1.3 / race Av1-4-5-6-7-8) TaxID=985895 RepID=E4ZVY1_LEPMJ|nr:predicted protein [Plenodomus lingam JN3]CBX95757.1 predicted protein [Plenodomus lingam JN3]